MPYLTGGLGERTTTLAAIAAAGADAIEVGIPFSDPVMDGPVIQEASIARSPAGATPPAVLDGLARADVGVPLAVMTYVNLVYRFGCERFARSMAANGVGGAILPDLPLEEAGRGARRPTPPAWRRSCWRAPTAPDERLARVLRAPAGSSTRSACWASPASGTRWRRRPRSSRRDSRT